MPGSSFGLVEMNAQLPCAVGWRLGASFLNEEPEELGSLCRRWQYQGCHRLWAKLLLPPTSTDESVHLAASQNVSGGTAARKVKPFDRPLPLED